MKVSVNIVTRNRPKLLNRAIESVLYQSFNDYEIVVVDNSGVDTVSKHVEQFNNPKIKVIPCPTASRGLVKARNVGLEASKGEYIAILDDDDIFVNKNKLAYQVEFLDLCKDYTLVGTNILVVSPNGQILGERKYPTRDEQIRDVFLVSNQFCHSATMFRKKDALDIGGYKPVEGMWNTNEYRLWLELGLKGKVFNIPIFGVHYTYWNNAYSFKHRAKLYWHDFTMVNEFKNDYPNYNDAVMRYLLTYPARYLLRMKWWTKIDHN